MALRTAEGEGTAQIKESGQNHNPATSSSRKNPPVTIGKEPGWATQTILTLLRRQRFCLYW
jgi:hypothetical protein